MQALLVLRDLWNNDIHGGIDHLPQVMYPTILSSREASKNGVDNASTGSVTTILALMRAVGRIVDYI